MIKTKKTLFIILLFLLAGTAVFLLAENGGEDSGISADLYFLSKDGAVILPEERTVSAGSTEDFCRSAVDEMIKGPADKEHAALMDKSVAVKSLSVSDGYVTVDFSSEFKNAGIMSTYAVVKTLCQNPGIIAVRVQCDGQDTAGGFISGDEINLESDDDGATGLDLYFADKSKTKLVAEYRRVNITDKQPVEQYIVAELIKGPKNGTNERLLSADTGVLSVETTDGTCYVNFKRDFISKNTSQESIGQLTVYSIVNSLTERSNVDNVQFLIDGKKVESFSGIDFDGVFERNENLIKEQ